MLKGIVSLYTSFSVQFLGVFHTKRTDLRVNAMMFQNYEPILWRGLKVNAFPILSYNTITRSAISDLAQSVCIAAWQCF